MTAALLAPVLLLLSAAGPDAPPAGPPAAEAPATATPPPPAAAPSPADTESPAPTEETQQELDARSIKLRAELEALQKQRAAWDDMRRTLDDLNARVDELARRAEQPPRQPRSSPLRRPVEPPHTLVGSDGRAFFIPEVRLQAGYAGTLVRQGPGQKSAPDTSTFLLQHAELLFEGNVLRHRFEYRLQFDFVDSQVLESLASAPGRTGDRPPSDFNAAQLLKDAFVQWRQGSWIAVRVGQYKLPFGFQRSLRSAYYDFVDLSETMAAFSLERDVGVMVLGRPLGGRLQYQLSVSNGAGAGKLNDNRDLAYTARVVAAPWGALPDSEGDLIGQARPLVSIGAAGYFNLVPTDVIARTNNPQAITDVDANGRVDNVAVWQGAVELRVHFRGAALQGELFRRLEHPGAGTADRTFAGEYLQASYFVLPHFLAVDARVERTDLPLYGTTQAQRNAIGDHIDGQTAGVSAFLRGHDLKIQADYSHLRTRGVVLPAGIYSPDSHRLRIAAQLMF